MVLRFRAVGGRAARYGCFKYDAQEKNRLLLYVGNFPVTLKKCFSRSGLQNKVWLLQTEDSQYVRCFFPWPTTAKHCYHDLVSVFTTSTIIIPDIGTVRLKFLVLLSFLTTRRLDTTLVCGWTQQGQLRSRLELQVIW